MSQYGITTHTTMQGFTGCGIASATSIREGQCDVTPPRLTETDTGTSPIRLKWDNYFQYWSHAVCSTTTWGSASEMAEQDQPMVSQSLPRIGSLMEKISTLKVTIINGLEVSRKVPRLLVGVKSSIYFNLNQILRRVDVLECSLQRRRLWIYEEALEKQIDSPDKEKLRGLNFHLLMQIKQT